MIETRIALFCDGEGCTGGENDNRAQVSDEKAATKGIVDLWQKCVRWGWRFHDGKHLCPGCYRRLVNVKTA